MFPFPAFDYLGVVRTNFAYSTNHKGVIVGAVLQNTPNKGEGKEDTTAAGIVPPNNINPTEDDGKGAIDDPHHKTGVPTDDNGVAEIHHKPDLAPEDKAGAASDREAEATNDDKVVTTQPLDASSLGDDDDVPPPPPPDDEHTANIEDITATAEFVTPYSTPISSKTEAEAPVEAIPMEYPVHEDPSPQETLDKIDIEIQRLWSVIPPETFPEQPQSQIETVHFGTPGQTPENHLPTANVDMNFSQRIKEIFEEPQNNTSVPVQQNDPNVSVQNEDPQGTTNAFAQNDEQPEGRAPHKTSSVRAHSAQPVEAHNEEDKDEAQSISSSPPVLQRGREEPADEGEQSDISETQQSNDYMATSETSEDGPRLNDFVKTEQMNAKLRDALWHKIEKHQITKYKAAPANRLLREMRKSPQNIELWVKGTYFNNARENHIYIGATCHVGTIEFCNPHNFKDHVRCCEFCYNYEDGRQSILTHCKAQLCIHCNSIWTLHPDFNLHTHDCNEIRKDCYNAFCKSHADEVSQTYNNIHMVGGKRVLGWVSSCCASQKNPQVSRPSLKTIHRVFTPRCDYEQDGAFRKLITQRAQEQIKEDVYADTLKEYKRIMSTIDPNDEVFEPEPLDTSTKEKVTITASPPKIPTNGYRKANIPEEGFIRKVTTGFCGEPLGDPKANDSIFSFDTPANGTTRTRPFGALDFQTLNRGFSTTNQNNGFNGGNQNTGFTGFGFSTNTNGFGGFSNVPNNTPITNNNGFFGNNNGLPTSCQQTGPNYNNGPECQ